MRGGARGPSPGPTDLTVVQAASQHQRQGCSQETTSPVTRFSALMHGLHPLAGWHLVCPDPTTQRPDAAWHKAGAPGTLPKATTCTPPLGPGTAHSGWRENCQATGSPSPPLSPGSAGTDKAMPASEPWDQDTDTGSCSPLHLAPPTSPQRALVIPQTLHLKSQVKPSQGGERDFLVAPT